jgi:hypothetical protein
MRPFVLLALLGSSVLFSSSLAQSVTNQAINSQNWKNHPRVVEIREMFSSVEKLLAARQLTVQIKKQNCGSYSETRTLWTDPKGIVRRFTVEGGSRISNLTSIYTYDLQGVLRFAYAEGGAVSGAEAEWRQYFGAQGQRFWTDYRWRKQQYPWPNVLGTQIRNPRAAFGAKLGC